MYAKKSESSKQNRIDLENSLHGSKITKNKKSEYHPNDQDEFRKTYM